MSDWGRVAEDGTVYVRTSEGERAVGSWQAGAPEEGLALFVRRFDALTTEVTLLEQRLRSGVGDVRQLVNSATRLQASLPQAAAVGDLDSLSARLTGLLERAGSAVAAADAQRTERRTEAVQRKEALAAEAESLAASSDWKTAGERLRNLGQDWKQIVGADRKTDGELWARVAAARATFAERRTAHFAALAQQRDVSKERKERLIAEAESLQNSTDWKPTAERYKQLMADWKTAGRATREVDDELWSRFKAAQDTFFTARSAQFTAQDEELRGNQEVKEAILAEAEGLDITDAPAAAARLRALADRWDAAGKVPRDVMHAMQDRMAAAERRVRAAGEARYNATITSPFEAKLKERLAELEVKLAKARTAGRPTEDLQRQVTSQRQLLGLPEDLPVEAENERPAAAKQSTTAWVRAQ
ncbi:MAG TPA: DUF349 domain-containing protein [Mycobacteriales bacterium]|nr:DUF349 domain-containing protein [Mycobacteriales bacterium]